MYRSFERSTMAQLRYKMAIFHPLRTQKNYEQNYERNQIEQ